MPRQTLSRLTCLLVYSALCYGFFLSPTKVSAGAAIVLSAKTGPPTTKVLVSGRGLDRAATVDIYFDKTYLTQCTTDSQGDFSKVRIEVPQDALAGPHHVGAAEENSDNRALRGFLVRVDWPQLQFDAGHTGYNPYENLLSPANVGNLALQWNLPSTRSFQTPAVANGVVYAGVQPGEYQYLSPFYGLDAKAGTPLDFFVPGDYDAEPAVVDGILYVATNSGTMNALVARTGAVLWSYQAGTAYASIPTIADGMVYFSSLTEGAGYSVYAVDARTGALVWSRFVNLYDGVGAITFADGLVYFDSSNEVIAVDAKTGHARWSFTANDSVIWYPAVVDGVAYFCSGDGWLYAVTARTGTLVWKSAVSVPYAPPAVAGGRIYVHSYDGTLSAFDAGSGMFLWSYATPACNCYQFPPAIANGVVYLATDISVYAVDAETGTQLWSHEVGGIYSGPVVVNGALYVGTEVSGLWAFGLKGNDFAEADDNRTTDQTTASGGQVVSSPTSKERIVHSFEGLAYFYEGENPSAGLVFDKDGILHGTTMLGGDGGSGYYFGTVFTLTPSGNETQRSLNTSVPYGGVTLDDAGNVFLTTYYGKSTKTAGAIVENLVVLSYFSGGRDGGNPAAGVTLDKAGNLYGTTVYGGAKCHYGQYCGVVYKYFDQKEEVLHTFTGKNDGRNPTSAVIFDRAGNLYGTTVLGGEKDCGVVYELSPSESGWSEKVLYAFHGVDGKNPHGAVVLDASGHLYGTTEFGGSYDKGVVFELTPNPDGTWTEYVLHSFRGRDGAYPFAGLILDKAHNLYGTTVSGGMNQRPYGTVFELTPGDQGWTETLLHSFGAPGDGAFPYAPVVMDSTGNLYGTTTDGGAYASGVVYAVTP